MTECVRLCNKFHYQNNSKCVHYYYIYNQHTIHEVRRHIVKHNFTTNHKSVKKKKIFTMKITKANAEYKA